MSNIYEHEPKSETTRMSLFNVGEDIRTKQNETALSILIYWRGVDCLVYRPSNPHNKYNTSDVYIDTSSRDAYGLYGDKFSPSDDNYDFKTKVLIYNDAFISFDNDDVSLPTDGYILSTFEFLPNDLVKILRRDLMDRFFLIEKELQFGTTRSIIHKYTIVGYDK